MPTQEQKERQQQIDDIFENLRKVKSPAYVERTQVLYGIGYMSRCGHMVGLDMSLIGGTTMQLALRTWGLDPDKGEGLEIVKSVVALLNRAVP